MFLRAATAACAEYVESRTPEASGRDLLDLCFRTAVAAHARISAEMFHTVWHSVHRFCDVLLRRHVLAGLIASCDITTGIGCVIDNFCIMSGHPLCFECYKKTLRSTVDAAAVSRPESSHQPRICFNGELTLCNQRKFGTTGAAKLGCGTLSAWDAGQVRRGWVGGDSEWWWIASVHVLAN